MKVCSQNYDEQLTSADTYVANGHCVVDALKTLLVDAETVITYSKKYQCDKSSDFLAGTGNIHPKTFETMNDLIAHITASQWIVSDHYYEYLPCDMTGSFQIKGTTIEFQLNLGGPGSFNYNDKVFKFSAPEYQDCYSISDCE